MTSTGTSHELILDNFEEIVAATAAVAHTHSEDHPLVLPSRWPNPRTLINGISSYQGPMSFAAEEAETIRTSLELVAEGESEAAAAYQPTAQRMLAEYQGIPWTPPPRPIESVTIAKQAPEPVTEAPTITEPLQGFIREDQVMLFGFREVLAVSRVIESVAPEDRAARRVATLLSDQIADMDFADPQTILIEGRAAAKVYAYANETADDDESIAVAEVEHLLEVGTDEFAVQQIIANAPQELVKPLTAKARLERFRLRLGDVAVPGWIRLA